VLLELGRRTGSPELKKLAVVLIDSDRFGASLAPALRTHARFLRTRRRQAAQEAARKLSVKLIFPVFFLIMPAVFVVSLGPAVLSFLEAMKPLLAP
jgi:tight adherence protein C